MGNMKDAKLSGRNLPAKLGGGAKPQWLTLKDASEFLGVHFTTLRNWADSGEIPVFRTPGGHRRFSAADLRRFLAERVDKSVVTDSDAVFDMAVGQVRQEIQKMDHGEMSWHYPLDAMASDMRRQRGRQLFLLAIGFVMKPGQRERILVDGRGLGCEYGREAAFGHVSLRDTGKAVQFFRSHLTQALASTASSPMLDADDVRVQQLINHFLDEVLYAVLDGYEEVLAGGSALQGSA